MHLQLIPQTCHEHSALDRTSGAVAVSETVYTPVFFLPHTLCIHACKLWAAVGKKKVGLRKIHTCLMLTRYAVGSQLAQM